MTAWLLHYFVTDYENVKDTKVRSAYGRLAGWVGIVCNLLLVAGKLAVGFISGSVAVIADGLNNLSDAASSIITLVGFRLASKKADKEHPFGHARFEYLAGLTVAVLVLVMGFELAKSSFDKIINPTPISFGLVSFVILSGSILLEIWMTTFNYTIGRHINSAALRAVGTDSRNDAIATTAVLAAAITVHFTGLNLDGWDWG